MLCCYIPYKLITGLNDNMSLSSLATTVSIHGAPKDFSLKDIKNSINAALKKDDAVKKVAVCKKPDGEKIPGKFEVELYSKEDAEELLEKHHELVAEKAGQFHPLKIVKPRSSSNYLSASTTPDDPQHTANLVSSVTIVDAPENCKLRDIKKCLNSALGKDDAVKTVSFCKTPDEVKIPGEFLVDLYMTEDAKELQNKASALNVEVEGRLYPIRILNPQSSTSQSPFKNFQTVQHNFDGDSPRRIEPTTSVIEFDASEYQAASSPVNPVSSVTIVDAPENCKLRDIKKCLNSALGKDDAVKTVSFCKTPDKVKIPGKFQVDLYMTEDVEKLQNKALALNVAVEGRLYPIGISKSQSSTNQPPFSSFQTVQHTFSNDGDSPRRIEPTTSVIEFDASEYQAASSSVNPDLDLPENPVTWYDLLQTDPDLFEKYSDSCVLVQNTTSHRLTYAQLSAYFENLEESGGGKIRKITRLADGVLVAFENEEDASRVVAKESHEASGTELLVYYKPVPSVSQLQILIKGNFGRFQVKDVADVVECLTTTSYEIEYFQNVDGFIVTFDSPVDALKMKKEVKKHALTYFSPKITQVCGFDCLKAENVKINITDDTIKMSFAKKKLIDGYVTSVQRDKDEDHALVFFADFRDAEKILEISVDQQILVAGSSVSVSPFVSGLTDLEKATTPSASVESYSS